MSQLVQHKVLPVENKMFSIYLKQDGDKSDSSILFGGLDEDAFLDHTNTTKIQADEDYSFPIKSFAIGETYQYLSEGTRAVFDPSYPFIYMPKADFREIAKKINAIFPTRLFSENTCESKWGTCYIEMSCDEVAEKELNETLDYSLEMNINGDDGDEMTLKLPMKDMLFKSKDDNRTDICILPIFSLGDV